MPVAPGEVGVPGDERHFRGVDEQHVPFVAHPVRDYLLLGATLDRRCRVVSDDEAHVVDGDPFDTVVQYSVEQPVLVGDHADAADQDEGQQ